jgi:hypothetical protein
MRTRIIMGHTVKNSRYWFRHDSKRDRTHLNKEFRLGEKQFFKKFRELLRKYKSRGWKAW